MTPTPRSILVVSPDPEVSSAVSQALSPRAGWRVDTEPSTLAQMNGKAVKVAGNYDMILFTAGAGDLADIGALQALAAGRPNTTLIALAEQDLTLAQARALNRAGAHEVVSLADIGSDIEGQIRTLDLVCGSRGSTPQPLGRVIAVTQSRGGIGSSTVAVNLADQLIGKRAGLFRRGAKASVALVDFDMQFGTVGTFLDLEEQDTLLQVAITGTIPDATFLDQAMVRTATGLDVLAAPSKFAPIDALKPEQVAAILDTLRQSHDYVVVDLPRVLVGWIEPIMQRADELIMVTDIGVSSVRHCRRLIDFFTADNPALPIEIVVNHERRPLMPSRLQREAEKVLQRKFDHWLPHDPHAARGAADRGQPLSVAAPRSSLTRAVARLAGATTKAFPAAIAAPTK